MTSRSEAPTSGSRTPGAPQPAAPEARPAPDLDERLDEADAESLPAGEPPAVTPPRERPHGNR
jgi:hypothetical protein